MARKLPWTASATQKSTAPPPKPRATPIPDLKPERDKSNHRPSTPDPIPHPTRKRTQARSPSTSPLHPPPQPIPAMSPMHTSDDRYIMVEDEFESMARQYTAHLHAAEYARLKRKARDAAPRRLPDAAMPGMPRSVSMNVERLQLLARQGAAVGSDAGDVVRGVWATTAGLAGLMDAGDRVRTSLVGVEKVNCSTRAAKGFGRGDTKSSSRKKRSIKEIFGGVGDKRDEVGDRRMVEGRGGGEREKVKRQKMKKSLLDDGWDEEYSLIARQKKMPVGSGSSAPVDRPTDVRRTGRKVFDDGFDGAEKVRSAVPASPSKPRRITTASRCGQKSEMKKDLKSRLDEVPAFFG